MISIVKPKIQIEEFDPEYIVRKIERAARTCYKTEGSKSPVGQLLDRRLLKTTDRAGFWTEYRGLPSLLPDEDEPYGNINAKLLKTVLANVHSSVLEHCTISVVMLTNRGMTHELVRHRIGCAYSQESSRYCNYGKDKFDNKVTMLKPYFYKDKERYNIWKRNVELSAKGYFELLKVATTEEARELLPNSTKTEITVTYNVNAWRHFFNLRASQKAHPEIRRIAMVLLTEFASRMPVLFGDIMSRHSRVSYYFPGIEDVELEYIVL
jgi:flavin-dependent thymidylate synthase